ncbi:hypothetical protein ACFL6T_05155 [Candidatus Zixiibacteriota bacterium]
MLLKRLSVAAILVMLMGFAGGCDELLQNGDDDPLAALAGTWITTAHVLTNPANTSQQFDLYAAGHRVTLIIQSNGNFTITFTDSDGSENDSGTMTLDGSTITVTTSSGESFDLTYLLIGGILTLTDTNSEYDFDDDGTDEAATSVMVFQHPEDAGSLTLADLAGSYMATTFIVTADANPSNSYDMISMGGFYTLVLQSDGTLDVIMQFPGDENGATHMTGTCSLVNNGVGLSVDFPGDEGDSINDLLVAGTSVILTNNDVDWDFGTGNIPASLTVNLVPVTPPTMAELDGYWTVTEILKTNPDNPTQTFDSIVEKVAMTFQLTSGGVFKMWDIRLPDSAEDENANDVAEDVYTLIGNVLAIGASDPILVQIAASGSNYVLYGSDSHDFDDDGTWEWAAMEMTLAPVTTHTLAEMEGAWVATDWTYVDPEDPSTSLNAITERNDIVTWVFDATGGFDVVQSRVDQDIDQFGGTSELFGNISASDDGSGNMHYVVFDVTASAFEFSMADWTDPLQSGTSSAWRTDVRMVPYTPATSTDFEGDWVASQWLLSDPYDVHADYDMVVGGGSFSLTINSGGTFSFSITFPGETTENGTGTWEIFGDLLLLTDDADGYVSAMQYTVGTDTFSMFSNNDSWDFNEDGSDEPALLNVIMVPPSLN